MAQGTFILGSSELAAHFRALPRVADKEFTIALGRSAKVMQRALQTESSKFSNRIPGAVKVASGTRDRTLQDFAGRFAGGRGTVYDVGVYIDEDEAPHALMVDEGTGLYGPKHKLIYPKNGKFMKFEGQAGDIFMDGVLLDAGDDDGSVTVYARSIKGMRPRPFVQPAFNKVAPAIEQLWRDAGFRVAARG